MLVCIHTCVCRSLYIWTLYWCSDVYLCVPVCIPTLISGLTKALSKACTLQKHVPQPARWIQLLWLVWCTLGWPVHHQNAATHRHQVLAFWWCTDQFSIHHTSQSSWVCMRHNQRRQHSSELSTFVCLHTREVSVYPQHPRSLHCVHTLDAGWGASSHGSEAVEGAVSINYIHAERSNIQFCNTQHPWEHDHISREIRPRALHTNVWCTHVCMCVRMYVCVHLLQFA